MRLNEPPLKKCILFVKVYTVVCGDVCVCVWWLEMIYYIGAAAAAIKIMMK